MSAVTSVTTRAWIVIGCAWSFYLYEYIIRVSPSVMVNDLMLAFKVNATDLGVIVSCYYLSYVALQIPCGVIVDKLGPRKVISFSSLLCVIGCFLFANSNSEFLAKFARFVMGAGSACAYLSTMKLAVEWMPKEKFAFVSGLTMLMGTLGGIFGASPFAILVDKFGWRSSITIAGIVGIFVMILCFFVIRDHPKKVVHHETFENSEGFLHGLKTILKTRQNWIIGAYGCMMYLPLSVVAELWCVPFIMEVYDTTVEKAAIGSICVFVGMGSGSVIGAWISDYLKSYTKVMLFSAVGTIILFALVFYLPMPIWCIFIFLFLGGLVSGGQILYFAAAKEIHSHKISGTVVGFTNCWVMTSGLVFAPLLGKLLDMFWSGTIKPDGTRHYEVSCYRLAFLSLIIGWIVSIILAKFFIKDSYPKSIIHENVY